MNESLLNTINYETGNIDVKNSSVVEYWAKSLGVTQTTLRRAVINAGPSLKNIKIWLIQKGFIK